MEGDGDGQLGFEHSSELMLCCPSPGINKGALAEKVLAGLAMNSGSMFNSSSGGSECCYGSGWEPIVPMNQSENFGAMMISHADFANPSYPIVSESKRLSGTSQFVPYSSDANVVETLPRIPVLGGGSFSGIVNSYCLPGCAQNSVAVYPTGHASDKSVRVEKASIASVQSQEDPRISEERCLVASPNGKRKRVSDPHPCLNPAMNAGGDMQRNSSGGIPALEELDEKKQKIEENGSSDQSTKQTSRQPKDNSPGEEASKGYIHVRARRGQATNSHSLAERVRREKISERMRLLQDLVPGCNKITGKAVMLDEIINYVQSLQQQVEFLSMKLATADPELHFDMKQILSKDILHSRGNSAASLGFNPGMSSAHLFTPGIHQGALPVMSNTTSPYHSLPQGMWDGDQVQTLLHMGFDSNPTLDLGPNGS